MKEGKPLLELVEVKKSFRLYARPVDRLKEALLGHKHHRDHLALDRFSLVVRQGESVGVLGRNGAGKSTLLKVIVGVLLPDGGIVRHAGRITGLLELGTGFDPSLSGRENIDINGRLLGMDAAEVRRKIDDIVAFSELEHFIDAPVRTYSSGMVMRLGFSIAIHAEPECFVVDEALSVGDARFQQKCMARIRAYRESGGGILFVSHDVNAIKMVCNRAIVLEQGRVLFDGEPEQAVSHYFRLIAGTSPGMQLQVESEGRSYGQMQIRIAAATLYDQDGGATAKFVCGQDAALELRIESDIDAELTVGFLIRDRFGQDIFGTNTALLSRTVRFRAGTESMCRFAFPVRLAPGAYTVTVAIHSERTHVHNCQHWIDHALELEVSTFGDQVFTGLCALPVDFAHWPVAVPTGGDRSHEKEIRLAS